MRTWLYRRIAAHGRLRAGLRLAMFGSEELAKGPHAPLLEEGSDHCPCKLALGHPRHGRAGKAALALLRAEGRPWTG
jgi:hypothetical protein